MSEFVLYEGKSALGPDRGARGSGVEVRGVSLPERSLTLKQPWAWAVFFAGKDIENRTWAPPPEFVGARIAIHAGKSFDFRGARFLRLNRVEVPEDLPQGVLLGSVRIDEVLYRRPPRSFWWRGPIGWRIVDPVEFEQPIPARGALNLWKTWRGVRE